MKISMEDAMPSVEFVTLCCGELFVHGDVIYIKLDQMEVERNFLDTVDGNTTTIHSAARVRDGAVRLFSEATQVLPLPNAVLKVPA